MNILGQQLLVTYYRIHTTCQKLYKHFSFNTHKPHEEILFRDKKTSKAGNVNCLLSGIKEHCDTDQDSTTGALNQFVAFSMF
jgi:hypothetical protein